METENIIISGLPIEIAEFDTYKLATFLISVLDEFDLNGNKIPKESGELYHATMRGFPIVAKLITDCGGNPIDFRGHEMTVERDENGAVQVKFGTMPIGSVVDTWIEEREVEGYVGKKNCLMISAKIWKERFPAYAQVLDKLWSEQKVKSSWEIKVSQSESLPLGKKILKTFSFIGNALLGTKVEGAVPSAGMYAYAELNGETVEDEVILAQALSNDVYVGGSISTEGEKKNLKNTTTTVTVPNVPETKAPPTIAEIASLTENDIRKKLNEAIRAKYKEGYVSLLFPAESYCLYRAYEMETQLEFLKFTYTVENDVVTVGEPEEIKLVVSVASINSVIAEKDNALVAANEKIKDLESQIAELSPYKEQAEIEEAAKIEAETAEKRANLTTLAQKSGFITNEEMEKDGDIKTMISEVNETGLRAVISTRFMESLNTQLPTVKTETASKKKENTVASVILEDEGDTNASLVKVFIGK